MYPNINRRLVLIRDDLAFDGVVPVYMVGDPELARYKAHAKKDRMAASAGEADGQV